MKFNVQFKDPDGVFESLRDAATDSARSVRDLSDFERDALIESRQGTFSDFAGAWIKYGEYVTIEFDTDAKTARVMKNGGA